LEESVAGPPEHLAEGFGRFSPPEFARFAVIARSSLKESQNHLHDAVDKLYLSEATRQDLDALAQTALKEVTGLLDDLRRQSKRTSKRDLRRRKNLKLNTNREAEKREV
jgi:four helix bundle protein